MNFEGIIIEESLADKSILDDIKIISTEIEPITESHKTPWVRQWTLHTFEVPADKADEIAKKISNSLDRDHNWYADYKNDKEHYIIFSSKVFHVTDRSERHQYDEATEYGISIGIPEYQVDFSPHVKQWER